MIINAKIVAASLTALLMGATLGAASFHEGRTQLTAEEQALALKGERREDGFERVWVAPGFQGKWHLLKWDADHSWAVSEAPNDLLERVREEVGRVNQTAGSGDDLSLAVTVYKYKRQGFLTNPVGQFELVARDPKGHAVWIAVDQVKSSQSLAESMADSDSLIMGRELHRKIRKTFEK
jgi:hypothetical protein